LIAEEGLAQELQAAVQKMAAEEKNQEMEMLMAKAQKTALSEDEKQRLSQWLKER
jgi:hypothetical protein